MTDKQTEALKLALEALEGMYIEGFTQDNSPINNALTAIRDALAEQQEPFGYFRYDLRIDAWVQNRAGTQGTPFYTSPPASKPWVGLTDEEKLVANQMWRVMDADSFIKALEAKLKEKNA